MPDFGNDYEKTLSGFSVVCDICGAEVKDISSSFNSEGAYGGRKDWKHTVEYVCGVVIYYQHGHGNKADYRLRKKCTEAHDIALKLKAKVEAMLEAVKD